VGLDGAEYLFIGILFRTTATMSSCSLFCVGHPLLDIQVRDGEELLKKYNLKTNDAILAEAQHQPMCVKIEPLPLEDFTKWIDFKLRRGG